MNVIKVYGGLGNQMFQYALGRTLMERNDDVAFDISWYDSGASKNPVREYLLEKFMTSVHTSSFLKQKTVHEDSSMYFKFFPHLLDAINTNFFGYWQNVKYFENVLPLLKYDFKLRRDIEAPASFWQLKEQIVLQQETVAIHIRRGDFLTPGHYLPPLTYYKEALLDLLKSKCGIKEIYIFSDDVAWCKEHFPKYVIVDEVDYLSFDLMRSCKHKILSNSTFSWWAAVLGEKSDGATYVPERWRLNEQEEEAVRQGGLIKENWIQYADKKPT